MKGILFKPNMIQAIIEGRKTQTRRVIKPQPFFEAVGKPEWLLSALVDKAPYRVGETVYLKEAWCESYYGKPICYKLDGGESPGPKGFWRSPMFLKAVNARYFIKITDVRAERLQEIIEEDAIAEGMAKQEVPYDTAPVWQYQEVWDSINKQKWESKPWVWVYGFEKVT